MSKMKVLMVSAEVEPFAKTGGLGDVVGSLPKVLNDLNLDCRVLMPLYGKIASKYKDKMKYLGYIYIDLGWRHQYCGVFSLRHNKVTYYFVDNEFYFNRKELYDDLDLEKFSFLDLAAFEVAKYVKFKPDVIHIHDWHTGAIAALLNDHYRKQDFFKNTKTVYTIHNLAYQGVFAKEHVLDMLPLDSSKYENTHIINLMALGIQYADKVTTVSPNYANEILTAEYGERLEGLLNHESNKLLGILNGIDESAYSCEKDKLIYHNFKKEDYENGKLENKKALLEELGFDSSNSLQTPLIAVISRLASQKGMDLLLTILNRLLDKDVRVVLLGSGDKFLENEFAKISYYRADKFRAILKFDNTLAHKIYASSDLFLMPSVFEPCGLAQMICLQYGTLPLVRACGGLKDSIVAFDEHTLVGNGFSFDNYNADDFYNTIMYALSVYDRKQLWNKVIENGFECDFSWLKSAIRYKVMYEQL